MRILACVLLVLSGCGGAEEACTRYASAWCARAAACGDTTFPDAATCQQRMKLRCSEELSAPSTGAGSGSVGRCTSALPSLACGHLHEGACAPPAGKLDDGTQCLYSSQCKSGHCTVPYAAPCGVCEPMAQAGESCGIGCDGGGLVCDPISYTCQMPVAAGASCGAYQPCDGNLVCTDGTCAAPPPPSPEPVAADGADCDLYQGPGCLYPAYCMNDGGSSTMGKCTLPDAGMCARAMVPRQPGPPSGPFMPAAHDTSFQVPSQGGPVLATPELVTITFADYMFRDQVDAYGDWIVGSDWLTQVGAEYGVGHGTHVKVHLPSPAPATMTDEQYQSQLITWQADGTVPSPGPNTIYMLYVRVPDTRFTGAYDIQACVDFLGYHDAVDDGQHRFSYSIIASCPPYGVWNELESTEITASHELIEAASDPYPFTNPGWVISDVFGSTGGEIADLCDGRNDREGQLAYQRIWSNVAAAKGGDPCLPPNPKEPYFRVEISPELTNLYIGPEQELTFSAWSSAPVGPLEVEVYFVGGSFAPQIVNPWTQEIASLGPGLPVTLPDAPVLWNGESGHLTFTLPGSARPGGLAVLGVIARSSTDVYTVWPFVIQAKAQPR